MIKDLVVNLSVAPERDPAAEFAISVARAFGAHLVGVAFQYDPFVPVFLMDGIPPAVIDTQRVESEQVAKAAIARFDEAARAASISFESHFVESSAGGGSNRFARLARRFGLSVIGQANPDKPGPEALFIESALFDSGRPVLVVPYIQRDAFKADRITLCWDGSRHAARAAADAMPFLERSRLVEVFIVDTGQLKSDEMPGADIAHHLARYGLNVEVSRAVAGDIDVANTILSHAADAGTDLLVMGGYGHTRLREFVLGGATRGILTSMTVPTLMSH